MDAFYLFLGIGAVAGILWVTNRYGVAIVLGALGCIIEKRRQLVIGFVSGVKGQNLSVSGPPSEPPPTPR